MQKVQLFHTLDSVDSTNNYAMARLNEGMAQHGMAWYAKQQTAGKGQRGKTWHSQPGSNILLSMVVAPTAAFSTHPFFLSVLVASECSRFLNKISGEDFYIKWPNDIYWRDRKTGGILIENKHQGTQWCWAVIGIGININQTHFAEEGMRATSLQMVTGSLQYHPEALAKELHEYLLEKINLANSTHFTDRLNQYNLNLYKRGCKVRLKKENAVFSTTIVGVNEYGQLITTDSIERQFNVGEVQWQFP